MIELIVLVFITFSTGVTASQNIRCESNDIKETECVKQGLEIKREYPTDRKF